MAPDWKLTIRDSCTRLLMLSMQPRQRSKVGACPVGNLGTAQRLGNALRVLIADDANDAALANRRRFDDLSVAMFMIGCHTQLLFLVWPENDETKRLR